MHGWVDVFRVGVWSRYWAEFGAAEISLFTSRDTAAQTRVAHIVLSGVGVDASVVRRGALQTRYTVALRQGGDEIVLGFKDPEERDRYKTHLVKACGCHCVVPPARPQQRRGSRGTPRGVPGAQVRDASQPNTPRAAVAVPRRRPPDARGGGSRGTPPQRAVPASPRSSPSPRPQPRPARADVARRMLDTRAMRLDERSDGSTVPAAPSPEISQVPAACDSPHGEPTFADALRAIQAIPQTLGGVAAHDDIETTSAESPPSQRSSTPRVDVGARPAVVPLPLPIPVDVAIAVPEADDATRSRGDGEVACPPKGAPAAGESLPQDTAPLPSSPPADVAVEAMGTRDNTAAIGADTAASPIQACGARFDLPLPSPVPSPITPACAARSPSQGLASGVQAQPRGRPAGRGENGAVDPGALLDLIYHYKQILRGKFARENMSRLHEEETNALLELLKDYKRILQGTVTRPDLVALLEKQLDFDSKSAPLKDKAVPDTDMATLEEMIRKLQEKAARDADALDTLQRDLAEEQSERQAMQQAHAAELAEARDGCVSREVAAALEEKCLRLEAENAMLRAEAHEHRAASQRTSTRASTASRSRSRTREREEETCVSDGELTLAERKVRSLEDTITGLECDVYRSSLRVRDLEREVAALRGERPTAVLDGPAPEQGAAELMDDVRAKNLRIDSLTAEVSSLRAVVDSKTRVEAETREVQSARRALEAEVHVLKELLQAKEVELLQTSRHGDLAREARQLVTSRVEKDLVFLRALLGTEAGHAQGAGHTAVVEAQQVCEAIEADIAGLKELLLLLTPAAAGARGRSSPQEAWCPPPVQDVPVRSATGASSQQLEEENRMLRDEVARLRIVNEAWSEHGDIEPRPSQPPQPSSPHHSFPSSRSTSHSRCVSPARQGASPPNVRTGHPQSHTADPKPARAQQAAQYVACHVCGDHFPNSVASHVPSCLKSWRATQLTIPDSCRRVRPPSAPTVPVTELAEYNRQAQHTYLTAAKNRCPRCLQRFDGSVMNAHISSCAAQGR